MLDTEIPTLVGLRTQRVHSPVCGHGRVLATSPAAIMVWKPVDFLEAPILFKFLCIFVVQL